VVAEETEAMLIFWGEKRGAGGMGQKRSKHFLKLLVATVGKYLSTPHLGMFRGFLELQKRYSEKINYSSQNSMELPTPELRCLVDFAQLPLEFCSGAMLNTPLILNTNMQ
jgi:hypothetical protein